MFKYCVIIFKLLSNSWGEYDYTLKEKECGKILTINVSSDNLFAIYPCLEILHVMFPSFI
jgi:hypothetical protein